MTPAIPRISYLVCATQRSGSTLLCEALGRTGVAGRPDEFFEGMTDTRLPQAPRRWFSDGERSAAVAGLSADWGPPHTEAMSALAEAPDYASYLEWVLEQGTTPNGVFGSKMMWSYLHDFAEQARELPRLRGLSLDRLLPAAFPGLRYLWVTRRDKVRQAVSMWKAVQTHAWRAGDGSSHAQREPMFDYDAIDHLKRLMAEHDAAWCTFFYRCGVRPLTVVYEDFEADYHGALARILDYLEVPGPERTIPEPPTAKQADATSQGWIERFRRLDEEHVSWPRGPRRPFPLRLTRADALWWGPEQPLVA